MKTKIGLLLGFALFYSCASSAAGGDFVFRVNDEDHRFPARCIESLEYHDKDDVYPERVNMGLTDECAKKLNELSSLKMGEKLSIYYGSNLVMSATIVTKLSANIMLTTDKTPRMVLMQMLTDYGITHG